ncbi:MAG: nSTAND1 domain-containing NTPase [Actinomycetota bacterium]
MSDAGAPALRTFLIADIRGYTTFTQERGDEAAAALATRFATIATGVLSESGGTGLELRGDEVLAVFMSVRQAIRAAARLQSAFVDATIADPSYPLGVGIGLDAGEAVEVEDGFRGGALNLAARLCALAGPGEILASQEVVHLARRVDGISQTDLGLIRLKGLAEPVRVSRLAREGWDPDADEAFQEAIGKKALGSGAGRTAMAVCPYRGMAAFQPEDGSRFFGRERLVIELVERLGGDRVLFVVGPSGSGKSSLVRAGLIPAMGSGALPGSDRWAVSLFSPRSEPTAELRYQLKRMSDDRPWGDAGRGTGGDDLRLLADSLTRRRGGVMLVIDQFEELFTLNRRPEQEAFIAAIAALTDPTDSRVHAVMAMRADFYGACATLPWLARRITTNQLLVGPMSRSDLKKAIEQPASLTGLRLEEGLVDAVLDDAGTEPASLPLVSHAMAETWRRREDGVLTLSGYSEAGGVAGSIAKTADSLYEISFDEEEQDACRRLVLRLVSPGEGTTDTRRSLAIEDLERDPTTEVSRKVAEAMVDARLLTVDRESLEIAHEALLYSWPRLRAWIEEGRDDLRARERIGYATAEWISSGRDPDLLYRGTPLQAALEWAGAHDGEMGPDEQAFLGAGHEASEEAAARSRAVARRSRRVRRVAVSFLAALTAVAAIASVLAFTTAREARSRYGQALATQARGLADADPRAATAVALEAMARGQEGSIEARAALIDAGQVLANARWVPAGLPVSVGDATTVSVSPTGDLIATGSRDGTISLWDRAGVALAGQVPGHTEAIEEMDFTPDGGSLVTGSYDTTILVWDVSDPRDVPPPGQLGETGEYVWSVDVSPDGRTVASASEDGTIRLWDLADRQQIGPVLADLEGDALTVAFAPDGGTLLAGNGEGEVVGWDVADRRTIVPAFNAHESDVWEIVFDPEGTLVATASSDGRVRVWDAATLESVGEPFARSADDVRGVLMGEDGEVVAGDEDGRLLVTSIGSSTRPTGWPARHGQMVDAAWGGGTLVTLGDDQSMQIWSAGGEPTAVEIAGLSGGAYAIAASPDGSSIAVGNGEGNVSVFSAATGDRRLGPIRLHEGTVWSLAYSEDGSRLASGGEDGTVRVLATDSGQVLATIPPADGGIAALLFADDVLLAGAGDGNVRMWNGEALRGELGPHAGGVTAMAMSASGELAIAGRDGIVRLWDIEEGRPLGDPFAADDNTIWGLAWSPDGRILATASDDEVVDLWDMSSRSLIGSLTPHPSGAVAVVFLDDGRTLVSTSGDGTVRVWDVARAAPVGGPLTGHDGTSWRVVALPGGRFATTGEDGTVRIWDVLDPARACERALGPFAVPPQSPYLGDDEPLACLA